MGKERPDLGLLNPSRPGPAGMGDGARELGREGGRALPGLRGAARDGAWGFEDTGPPLGVCGGSPTRDWDPVEFGGSGLSRGWISRELGVMGRETAGGWFIMGSFGDFGNSILRVCRGAEWKGVGGHIIVSIERRGRGSGIPKCRGAGWVDLGLEAGVRSWIFSGW